MSTDVQRPTGLVPEPVHLVALTGIHTMAGKIRYACEHSQPDPTVVSLQGVRDWLALYGVHPSPEAVWAEVQRWRAEHGLPPLTTWLAWDSPATPTTTGAMPVSQSAGRRQAPPGAKGFYFAALLSMVTSIDTSWRFFADVLHITNVWERVVMFAVLEVAMVACGYGMRANVHRTGRPGAPRLIAWLLCGVAGYMAWQLSGLGEGIARVVLGPVIGLGMLHLALGIEKRAGQHKTGTWARIGGELRERLLSRVGLADDERDALARTRDRAVQRAARLALASRWTPFRQIRLARALRAGNVPHNASARTRLLADLATARHANELATLSLPSPWHTDTSPHPDPDPSHQALHDTSRPAGDTRRVAPPPAAPATTPARPRTATTRERRNSAGSTGGKGRGRRPTREEYLARARAAYADSAPVTVTAQWVQAAVPGISRSMSYVIADALSTEPGGASLDSTGDGAVDGVRGHGPDGPADGVVDVAGDVSVDTDQSLSVNGGAR